MNMITTVPSPIAETSYDVDFCAWSTEQARIIRALAIPGLDNENVAEEIESLGRSDKRELLSRTAVLLAHLLKWQFQPERRSDSWMDTITEQRQRIEMLLDESPSLRPTVTAMVEKAYRYGRKQAIAETKLPTELFPMTFAWSADQIYEEGWLPD